MLDRLWQRLITFQDHHQVLFAVIIALGIISCSWGIEKLFETFLFPRRPVYGYIFALFMGALLLWITKHLILHEF